MSVRNIQKEILGNLLQSEGLKYSQARPKGVENDLYNYHLQFLVKKGYVEKIDELYNLTVGGKKHINDTVSLSQPSYPYETFKMSVLCCVLKLDADKILMLNQERGRHPFFGDKGIISGKIRKEESVTDTAARKLFEETGLKAEFKNIGLIRKVRYLNSKQDFFSDSFWFFCITDSFNGDLEEENKFGKHSWQTIEESIENELSSTQGSKNIANLYMEIKEKGWQDRNFFYFEEFNVIEGV